MEYFVACLFLKTYVLKYPVVFISSFPVNAPVTILLTTVISYKQLFQQPLWTISKNSPVTKVTEIESSEVRMKVYVASRQKGWAFRNLPWKHVNHRMYQPCCVPLRFPISEQNSNSSASCAWIFFFFSNYKWIIIINNNNNNNFSFNIPVFWQQSAEQSRK